MRAHGLTALVLHLRPYRETSAMVQFFTREHGRVVGVMKGLHRARRQFHVQPFQLGQLSVSGGSGLLTVTTFEVDERFQLEGDALSAGFYVLELVSRGLAERQAEPGVFDAAICTLRGLSGSTSVSEFSLCLRRFESVLLQQLGYGLDFAHEGGSGTDIEAKAYYRLVDEQGFVRDDADGQPSLVPGWILLCIAAGDYGKPEVARAARLLNQQALKPLIGPEPIVSRSLYTGQSRG